MPLPPKQNKAMRQKRLESLLLQLLGPILKNYLDDFPEALVSVSRVEISGDLRWAKVWLSILNASDDAVLNRLKKSLYHIQGELNQQVEMKIVPRLQLFVDTSARFAAHLNVIIDNLPHD